MSVKRKFFSSPSLLLLLLKTSGLVVVVVVGLSLEKDIFIIRLGWRGRAWIRAVRRRHRSDPSRSR